MYNIYKLFNFIYLKCKKKKNNQNYYDNHNTNNNKQRLINDLENGNLPFGYTCEIINNIPIYKGPKGGTFILHNHSIKYINQRKRIKKTKNKTIFVNDFINNELLRLKNLDNNLLCPICFDLNIQQFASCGHGYCLNCFSKINQCSICRLPFI